MHVISIFKIKYNQFTINLLFLLFFWKQSGNVVILFYVNLSTYRLGQALVDRGHRPNLVTAWSSPYSHDIDQNLI